MFLSTLVHNYLVTEAPYLVLS